MKIVFCTEIDFLLDVKEIMFHETKNDQNLLTRMKEHGNLIKVNITVPKTVGGANLNFLPRTILKEFNGPSMSTVAWGFFI